MRTSSAPRAAALLLGLALAACGPGEPLPVGVLLPTSTERGASLLEALRWAVEVVNDAGGARGRPLELVVEDSGDDADAAARRLLAGGRVRVVLGPERSSAVFDAADVLLEAKVPFISPSATSGDFFRAFAGNPLAWRTVESDVGQLRTLTALARRDGASTVAFLGGEDHYGDTFFNWFGFFATTSGLRPTRLVSTGQQAPVDCVPLVLEALADAPDVLLVTPSDTATATCFARALATRRGTTRVLFSDTGNDPALLAALGPLAEGLEGTVGVADPGSTFDEAWRARTGAEPPAYAAQAWDAVLLAAYGLTRANGAGGEALGAALQEVVSGRGRDVASTPAGVREALAGFAKGEPLNPRGAAGALDFDRQYATDVTSGTWGHWVVRDGQYVIVERLSSADGRTTSDRSVAEAYAPPLAELSVAGPVVGARTGLKALVVAASRGWSNYRHQADALAVSAALERGGLGDDDIVLVTADDLATDARNLAPGVVRHVAGGPDLRASSPKDYALDALRTGDLWAVLRGEPSARTPTVLNLSPGEDLLVYLVGHGSVRGLEWAGDPGDQRVLLPNELADALAAVQDRYRRAVVVVDSCLAGVMADALVAREVPRVLVLTSSDRHGGSFAANYDPALGAWLADQFTFALVTQLEAAPTSSLFDTLRDLYARVPGSYVSAWNAPRFGRLGEIPTRDFFAR